MYTSISNVHLNMGSDVAETAKAGTVTSESEGLSDVFSELLEGFQEQRQEQLVNKESSTGPAAAENVLTSLVREGEEAEGEVLGDVVTELIESALAVDLEPETVTGEQIASLAQTVSISEVSETEDYTAEVIEETIVIPETGLESELLPEIASAVIAAKLNSNDSGASVRLGHEIHEVVEETVSATRATGDSTVPVTGRNASEPGIQLGHEIQQSVEVVIESKTGALASQSIVAASASVESENTLSVLVKPDSTAGGVPIVAKTDEITNTIGSVSSKPMVNTQVSGVVVATEVSPKAELLEVIKNNTELDKQVVKTPLVTDTTVVRGAVKGSESAIRLGYVIQQVVEQMVPEEDNSAVSASVAKVSVSDTVDVPEVASKAGLLEVIKPGSALEGTIKVSPRAVTAVVAAASKSVEPNVHQSVPMESERPLFLKGTSATILDEVAAKSAQSSMAREVLQGSSDSIFVQRPMGTEGVEDLSAAKGVIAPNKPDSGIEGLLHGPSRVSTEAVSTAKGVTLAAEKADVPVTTVRNVGEVTIRSIRHLVGSSEESVRIRLVPRSLGELNISVTTNGDGVDVVVLSSSKMVSDVLEEQMSGLKNILQKEGVEVSSMKVQTGSKFDMGSFLSNSHSRSQEGNSSAGHARNVDGLHEGHESDYRDETPATTGRLERSVSHDGDLNVFV